MNKSLHLVKMGSVNIQLACVRITYLAILLLIPVYTEAMFTNKGYKRLPEVNSDSDIKNLKDVQRSLVTLIKQSCHFTSKHAAAFVVINEAFIGFKGSQRRLKETLQPFISAEIATLLSEHKDQTTKPMFDINHLRAACNQMKQTRTKGSTK